MDLSDTIAVSVWAERGGWNMYVHRSVDNDFWRPKGFI